MAYTLAAAVVMIAAGVPAGATQTAPHTHPHLIGRPSLTLSSCEVSAGIRALIGEGAIKASASC
jgi:hypothetical protein